MLEVLTIIRFLELGAGDGNGCEMLDNNIRHIGHNSISGNNIHLFLAVKFLTVKPVSEAKVCLNPSFVRGYRFVTKRWLLRFPASEGCSNAANCKVAEYI